MFDSKWITYLYYNSVIAAEVSEDSSLLAVGFSDSSVKVFSLVPQKLRIMKDGEQLADVDREAGALKLLDTFSINLINH